MTDTLAPVERTNWALSAWNSTLDQNDVPSAWLYGQDHLWATDHLVSSPREVFPPPSHTPTCNTSFCSYKALLFNRTGLSNLLNKIQFTFEVVPCLISDDFFKGVHQF